MSKYIILLVLSICLFANKFDKYKAKNINGINKYNSYIIEGEINNINANKFNLVSRYLSTEEEVYIIFYSHGGTIEAANSIIESIKSLEEKTNVTCIAYRGFSAAFWIFENCKKRYILEDGTIMWHNPKIWMSGFKLLDAELFINTTKQKTRLINIRLSEILKIKYEDLEVRLMFGDWYMDALSAIENNAADGIVRIGK